MDIGYLKEILHYDPETGAFTWLVTRGRMAIEGAPAGTTTKKGGRRIGIDGRYYHAHRLAWFYVYGNWPEDQIDHRDLDSGNNRITNLREATNSQNGANKRRSDKNQSGYKGVAYKPVLGKWIAQIKHNTKVIHIGCFDDPALAHEAYAAKARELHGEFARVA